MTPDRASARPTYDVVIAGGGLAGQLCALALRSRAPHLSLALLERSPRLGGSQTWCCHESDLVPGGGAAVSLPWFFPLVDKRWTGYRVRFPDLERTLPGDYLCLRADALARVTERQLRDAGGDEDLLLLTGRDVSALTPTRVLLDDGTVVNGRLVIDARGTRGDDYRGRCGFQKFLGWEIALPSSTAAIPNIPTLMDASVEQVDGYRFIYVLPFSPSRLLVEDTYFSRRSDLDRDLLRERLRQYLRAQGWNAYDVVREEAGVLPMPWSQTSTSRDTLAVGYRGGFFHPGTGYSLARAVLVADCLAKVAATAGRAFATSATEAIGALARSWHADDRFARLLNRLAFRALAPERLRDSVFARVYRLPAPVISRFYAGRTSLRDRLAIATAPVLRRSRQPAVKPMASLGETP